MTKGSVFDFVGLYAALLKDVAAYLPTTQREWDRDLLRITTLSQTRGPTVFTMDLPAMGKKLDAALSRGRLDLKGMPCSGPTHSGSMIPRLFRELWIRLFDHSGCLRANIDPNVVLFLRTLLYVGKNYKSECAPRYLFEATKEFSDVESSLPPASPLWDGDGSDVGDSHYRHLWDMVSTNINEPLFHSELELVPVLDSVQRSADRICRVFSGFDPGLLDFKHGPGAVSDLRRGDYKYSFPNWAPRLEFNFPYDFSASTSLEVGGVDPVLGYGWDSYEPHSDLKAVPKTMKGPRLIAKESTCMQWVQQGIRNFLYHTVARTWIGRSIDFFSQSPSRDLALQASRDGYLCTIDLKSASDRITCALVERLFRSSPNLLGAMIASRTRFLVQDLDKKLPRVFKLKKFSTQGSALTFPVQSIVFFMICVGVGKHLHPSWSYDRLGRQVRIFGDDLIIPGEWEPLVERVLETLHLRVNHTKTHVTGRFRESCGMDAFEGYDVSPPYVLSVPVESDPATISSGVAVSNNFFMKGFWHASSFLERSMSNGIRSRMPIVKVSSGLFALRSFSGSRLPSRLRERWNETLQRREVAVLAIFAKPRLRKTETVSNLLQYFTEDPPPYIKYESGTVEAGVPVFRNAWVDPGVVLM